MQWTCLLVHRSPCASDNKRNYNFPKTRPANQDIEKIVIASDTTWHVRAWPHCIAPIALNELATISIACKIELRETANYLRVISLKVNNINWVCNSGRATFNCHVLKTIFRCSVVVCLCLFSNATDRSNSIEGRHKRGVVKLYSMVKCATGCDPLIYKGYGCYCGFLGSGRALDGIDRWVHGNLIRRVSSQLLKVTWSHLIEENIGMGKYGTVLYPTSVCIMCSLIY